MKVVKLQFLTTQGCHLCDEAMALFKATGAQGFFDIDVIDIANDDSLIEIYGERIPVFRSDGLSKELGWPFSIVELNDFLTTVKQNGE